MRIFVINRILFYNVVLVLSLVYCVVAFEQGNALRSNYTLARWPSDLGPALRGSFHDSQFNLRHWWKDSDDFQNWSWEIAIESSWRFSSHNSGLQAAHASGTTQTPLRIIDLETDLNSSQNNRQLLQMDRFWYHWRHKNFDYTVGRQAIGLGTSHFVSVLDILAPFSPGTLDSTYRPGVDAIRIQTPKGDTGERDLILAFASDEALHSFLYRERILLGNYDVESIFGRAYGRNLAGLGFEGSNGKLSKWGEFAIFERKEDETIRSGSRRFARSAVLGFEYFTPSGNEWGLSYFHQDFGASNGRERIQFLTESLASQGWIKLSGRNYTHLRFMHPVKPLINLSLNCVYNLDDRSAFYQPRLDVNISDNANLSIFAWIKSGTSSLNPFENTEFGSIATGAGVFLQYYF